jgi:hypothetical protein
MAVMEVHLEETAEADSIDKEPLNNKTKIANSDVNLYNDLFAWVFMVLPVF